MKRTNRIMLAIGLAAAAGFAIYAIRRHQTNKRYARIADEGYETAHDILYPQQGKRKKRVHYGPVLPD